MLVEGVVVVVIWFYGREWEIERNGVGGEFCVVDGGEGV